MSNENIYASFLLAFLLLVFGSVAWQYYTGAQECKERGGVPLRGAYWFECVDVERR